MLLTGITALVALVAACPIYSLFQLDCENEVNGLRDNIEVDDIKIHLLKDVFGQPLVHTILPKVLEEYSKQQESGPLILSFHGSPGTGKNFVTNILAHTFFVRGPKSKFFHSFLATKDFPDTTNGYQFGKYKEDLRKRLNFWSSPSPEVKELCCFIQGLYEDFMRPWSYYSFAMRPTYTKENTFCRRMFVFDEVDSLPDNLLTTVNSFMTSPFFSKTIFVFLSNVGGREIYKEIEALEMHNITKDQIDQNKLVKLVQEAVTNSPPKYNPSIVQHIVPFLPLERDHVTMCIRREITRRKPFIRENDLIRMTENVLQELLFHGFKDKYSIKGCKNVVEKVNLVLARERI